MTSGNPESREDHLPRPGESWTPIRLTRWSGEYLREKGVENGRLDAELLLASVLDVDRLDLYLQHDRPLQKRELDAFKVLLRRRAGREPLQYVLGRTAFREIELRTDPRALIPRPETEVLVEEILSWAANQLPMEPAEKTVSESADQESRWPGPLTGLDLGTGTGAIALSLLKEGPFSRFVATDPSPEALELARENAEGMGILERLDLRAGALFEPLRPDERFDVVVSNPPYVADGERGDLQEEVRDWEPTGALFAGSEGLDVLLPLVRGVGPFLKKAGLLALEIGEGHDRAVSEALEDTGAFREVSVRKDLAGRERVVLGVARG